MESLKDEMPLDLLHRLEEEAKNIASRDYDWSYVATLAFTHGYVRMGLVDEIVRLRSLLAERGA